MKLAISALAWPSSSSSNRITIARNPMHSSMLLIQNDHVSHSDATAIPNGFNVPCAWALGALWADWLNELFEKENWIIRRKWSGENAQQQQQQHWQWNEESLHASNRHMNSRTYAHYVKEEKEKMTAKQNRQTRCEWVRVPAMESEKSWILSFVHPSIHTFVRACCCCHTMKCISSAVVVFIAVEVIAAASHIASYVSIECAQPATSNRESECNALRNMGIVRKCTHTHALALARTHTSTYSVEMLAIVESLPYILCAYCNMVAQRCFHIN